MITPFTPDARVDFDMVKTLVDFLPRRRCEGIIRQLPVE